MCLLCGEVLDSYQLFSLRLVSIFSFITSSSPSSQYRMCHIDIQSFTSSSHPLCIQKKKIIFLHSQPFIPSPYTTFLYLFTALHQFSATLFLFQDLCTVLLLGRTNCTCKCIRESTMEPCCSCTCSDQ